MDQQSGRFSVPCLRPASITEDRERTTTFAIPGVTLEVGDRDAVYAAANTNGFPWLDEMDTSTSRTPVRLLVRAPEALIQSGLLLTLAFSAFPSGRR